MKKVILLIAICSVLFFTKTTAQKLSVQWSEKQFYNSKSDGYFNSYVGGNSKFIYAKFTEVHPKRRKSDTRIKILGFDKTTMKKLGDVTLLDVKNEESKNKYKDMLYFRTIVFENIVYVFWTKETKTEKELYAESYTNKLKPNMKLKKVYGLKFGERRDKQGQFIVMSNKNIGEQILIGGELTASIDKNVVMEYKLLNSDFSFSDANQITLPIIIKSVWGGLSSSYELGDDNNLHIKTYVTMDKEEAKGAKKGESTSYPIYTVVNPKTGAKQTYNVKFENKNIFNFDFIVGKSNIKLFGFFCDLLKDPKGYDNHGIFYGMLDSKTFKMNNLKFSYFNKTQLDQLFASDKMDRKDEKLFSSAKKKKSEEESVPSDYEIEDVHSINNDLVLFCSRMNNYTVTTRTKDGGSTTRYYCEKSNVTTFRINAEGSIVWASNIDRYMKYDEWNVYDLKVALKGENFYIMYGSNQKNARVRSSSYKESPPKTKDYFEYAVIDNKTGNYSVKYYSPNALNTPKKERKEISVADIQVVDDQLYVNSSRLHAEPIIWVIGCAGALICPPLILLPFTYRFQVGDGYLGKIVTE